MCRLSKSPPLESSPEAKINIDPFSGGVQIREAPQSGAFSAKPSAGRPTEKVLNPPRSSSFQKWLRHFWNTQNV